MNVVITGGAGYVGSVLVPHLLTRGYSVKVLDLFMYGNEVFRGLETHSRLVKVKMDIRDKAAVLRETKGADALLHLACISNDPSFDLDPALGKSINYDAFFNLLEAIRQNGIKRFVYASSSSVYGIKEKSDVLEEDSCEPLTDYSKYKMMCEDELRRAGLDDLCTWVILRPATVCGYGSRLRLDLTVNILTIHALVNRRIRVFGGSQRRPNLHIQDMAEVYQVLLEAPAEKIHRQVFNAGYQNLAVSAIADIVKQEVGQDCEIVVEPSDDPRSYHVNSDKIARVLGFKARHTIQDAVRGIAEAYQAGKIQNPLHNPLYFNIKRMKDIKLEQTVSHA